MASGRVQSKIGFFRSPSPEQKENFHQLLEEDRKSGSALNVKADFMEKDEADAPILVAAPEKALSCLVEEKGKEEEKEEKKERDEQQMSHKAQSFVKAVGMWEGFLSDLDEGNSPILRAAKRGNNREIEKLLVLESGAILTEKNYSGNTALLLAAKYGHTETVKFLLLKGASITEKDNSGYTALLWAANSGYTETVKFFLLQGASLTERSNYGDTALLLAASNGHTETVKFLLLQGSSLTEKGGMNNTALLLAAEHGYTETVKFLLEKGSLLTEKNEVGITALLLATKNGHTETVKFLLLKGASITEKDYCGDTALFWAIGNDRMEMVKFLLEKGAILNEKNNSGDTALLLAAFRSSVEMVKFLTLQGAFLNEKNEDGDTALLRAACMGNIEKVKFLLLQGASLTEKNNQGYTVLDLAAKNGHSALRQWLVLYEAMKSKEINKQITALKSVLAYRGDKKIKLYFESACLLLSSPCEPLLIHKDIADYKELQPGHLLVTKYDEVVQERDDRRYLALSRCYWEPFKIQNLLAYLKCSTRKKSITHLTFSESLWPKKEESWLFFIEELPSIPLQYLELSYCQLNDEKLLSLANALLKMKALRTCVLDGNHMSYRGFRDFIASLCCHPSLSQLSLRENRIKELSKTQMERDVSTLLRQAKERGFSLQKIDITGNYFMSKGHDLKQLEVLRLLLKETALNAKEFSQAEWVREEESSRPSHTVLRLRLNNKEHDFEVPMTVMDALTRYRAEYRLESDAKTFQDLQMSAAHTLRHYPKLKEVRLSSMDANATTIKEQKRVCKSLLFYHPDTPLKAYLRSHPFLHTGKLEKTICLLHPQQLVTPREWNVYFIAKRGEDVVEIIKNRSIKEHAMIGWEGVYSYGQRVIKMAELTVETRRSGFTVKRQLVISYFPLEIERIASFRKHYVFAAFRTSKEKVKEMEKVIDREIGDMPGKYRKILGSGSEVSEGLSPEDQGLVTTNCQKWALEKLEQCLGLSEKILQGKMAIRPSVTVIALQAMPQALSENRRRPFFDDKKPAGSIGRSELELEVEGETPTQGKRCVLM